MLGICPQTPCVAQGILKELANIPAKVFDLFYNIFARFIDLFARIDNCIFSFL